MGTVVPPTFFCYGQVSLYFMGRPQRQSPKSVKTGVTVFHGTVSLCFVGRCHCVSWAVVLVTVSWEGVTVFHGHVSVSLCFMDRCHCISWAGVTVFHGQVSLCFMGRCHCISWTGVTVFRGQASEAKRAKLTDEERTSKLAPLTAAGWTSVQGRDAIYKEFLFKDFNEVTSRKQQS